MEYVRDFKPIPFSRVGDVPSYIGRKLEQGKVIIGVTVSQNRVTEITSYCRLQFYAQDNSLITTVFSSTVIPCLATYKDNNEPIVEPYNLFWDEYTLSTSKYENPDYRSFNKHEFPHTAQEYIELMDPAKDYQEFWFLSDDNKNYNGPLQCYLCEYFHKLHPEYEIKVYSH